MEDSSSSSSSLLSLQFYSSPEELSSFLVIEAEEVHKENLDLFTPTFMQWQKNIWIFDLKSCRKYWMEQAKSQKLSLHELLKTHIERSFVLSSRKSYRAVLGPHPWPNLLLLRLMKERNLSDLLLWETPYAQTLYRALSWPQWLDEVRLLGELMQGQNKAIGSKHRSQLLALARAMRRLAMKSPWELRKMASSSLQRRYGALVGRAWSWTFPEAPKKREQLSLFDFEQCYPYDLKSFPWVPYKLPEPPQSHRLLEYPVTGWESIKELLREDLDKLLKHKNFSKAYLVCELEWRVLLSHFKELVIPITFHRPHPLHEEEGEHKTSLNQFYYAYERAMKKLKQREEDLDLPLQIPFVSWELRLSQKFSLSPQAESFISATGSLARQLPQLRDLSNKLPAPLVSYSLYPDFCPERSFGPEASSLQERELVESWRFAAKRRPLFIFKKARALPRSAFAGPRFFLERSSDAWWEKGQASHYYRDYFLVQDKDRKWLWAYRTPENQWFQHGIYS